MASATYLQGDSDIVLLTGFLQITKRGVTRVEARVGRKPLESGQVIFMRFLESSPMSWSKKSRLVSSRLLPSGAFASLSDPLQLVRHSVQEDVDFCLASSIQFWSSPRSYASSVSEHPPICFPPMNTLGTVRCLVQS